MDQQDRPGRGSIALVTGATSGIGLEIARALSAEGLEVWLGGRHKERIEQAVAEIGGSVRGVLLDVTDATSIRLAADRIGALDVLVNNAGIGDSAATIADEPIDSFRQVYETNVFGLVAVTQAFLPALRRSAHPRVINITSGGSSLAAAVDPHASLAFGPAGSAIAYRSSKTAVNAITVLTAQALAEDGVLVNAVMPGLRRTKLNAATRQAGGDPAEGAAGVVRIVLEGDGGPSAALLNWDGTPGRW